MEKKKILILGCGWSGKITAEHFIENNIGVWGSTTQASKIDDLAQAGIHPILLNFSVNNDKNKEVQEITQHEFELILISVNVRRNEDPQECLDKFKNLLNFIKPLHYKQIVFLSSIGVYTPIAGEITEKSEVVDEGNLYVIEEYLKTHLKPLVILRLGGLFGHGRIPGKYFSNKTCTVGAEKANYVHGDDVAHAIYTLFINLPLSETFNLVAPNHPPKKEIYDRMAIEHNFPPPTYEDGRIVQKEVSSKKIIEDLGFKFQTPSPLDF